MKLTFKIWRQSSPTDPGALQTYVVDGLNIEMSLLEALDFLNESLVLKGETAIAFDHDCREGICGQCGFNVDGRAHGPHKHETTCRVHLRSFTDGQTLTLEPFRAKSFPLIKDLVIDRSAFDRIIQHGGFVSANTGTAREANSILVGKEVADKSMCMAACIGCGACVATCKNASASLFTAAKLIHLNVLPQGKPEASRRTLAMVAAMSDEGFGHCSFTGSCEAECPQEISLSAIAEMNWDYMKAKILKD